MTQTSPQRSRWLPLLLTTLVVVGGAGAWVLRAESGARQEAADRSTVEVAELDAARLRIEIGAAAFAQLTSELRMLAEPGPTRVGPDHRADLRRAGDALADLVEGGLLADDPASIADDLLEALDRALATEGDLWALEETAYVSSTPSGFGPPESDAEVALLAATLATSPSLVAIDAWSLTLLEDVEGLEPAAADYVDSTATIVLEDPGWYGPEADSPFEGGYLAGDLLAEQDPALLAALTGTAGLEDVWRYDQWLISRLDESTPPPTTLGDLATAAAETQHRLVEHLLFDLDETIAAGRVTEPGPLLVFGWIAASAVSLLAVAALATTIAARTRRLAEVAFIDPLTKVGNRRRLEQLESEWSTGGGPAHAAVAVFDLDRFKLINDSLGHAVGDLVLRHVGAELQALAAEARPDVDHVEVIRLGGDEFAVIVGASRPQVETVLHDRIASIGGPIEVTTGETVDIGLSVGVVTATLPDDLGGLLAAADLRAYEAKERRRASTGPIPRPERVRL